MGARLRVFLTREQDQTLLNLRTVDVPQKVNLYLITPGSAVSYHHENKKSIYLRQVGYSLLHYLQTT